MIRTVILAVSHCVSLLFWKHPLSVKALNLVKLFALLSVWQKLMCLCLYSVNVRRTITVKEQNIIVSSGPQTETLCFYLGFPTTKKVFTLFLFCFVDTLFFKLNF